MMCSYDYKREYQLGLETTILVKSYTVSILPCFCVIIVLFILWAQFSSDQLPDGRVIKVGTERFQAPEALFTPVSLFLFYFIAICKSFGYRYICTSLHKYLSVVVLTRYIYWTGTHRCWRWWFGRYGIPLHSGNGHWQPDDGIHPSIRLF
jgi:hypothetical protein